MFFLFFYLGVGGGGREKGNITFVTFIAAPKGGFIAPF